MDQISEIIKRVQKHETKFTGISTGTMPPRELPKSWIAAIFEKMRRRYGNQWTSQYGDCRGNTRDVMQEWASVLGQLSSDDIKRGLDIWDSQYPPNVFQFRDACMLQAVVPAHKRFQAGQRSGKADIDVARGQIEVMRRKINLHYL